MSDERSEFLSLLLGREVEWRQNLRLTSGQKARYFAWCQERNLDYQLGDNSDPLTSAPDTSRFPLNAIPNIGAGASIRGVGVDLQQVSELFPEAFGSPKTDPSLTKIFTLRELSYAEGSDDVRQTLAGIFAAKEAVFKALGEPSNRNFHDVEILPDENGAPSLDGFLLSVSHSGGFAVAIAAGLYASPNTAPPRGAEESLDHSKSGAKTSNERAQQPKMSRRRRIFRWVARYVVLLGTIGGIWVLIEKFRLLA